MNLTAAQKSTVRHLAAAYNRASATGTGRQAERAERLLNEALDSILAARR